jgi:hypothetical protein
MVTVAGQQSRVAYRPTSVPARLPSPPDMRITSGQAVGVPSDVSHLAAVPEEPQEAAAREGAVSGCEQLLRNKYAQHPNPADAASHTSAALCLDDSVGTVRSASHVHDDPRRMAPAVHVSAKDVLHVSGMHSARPHNATKDIAERPLAASPAYEGDQSLAGPPDGSQQLVHGTSDMYEAVCAFATGSVGAAVLAEHAVRELFEHGLVTGDRAVVALIALTLRRTFAVHTGSTVQGSVQQHIHDATLDFLGMFHTSILASAATLACWLGHRLHVCWRPAWISQP